MSPALTLILSIIVIFVHGGHGLRCWVCGGHAGARYTHPNTAAAADLDDGGSGGEWCSASGLANATCGPGAVQCYKELWVVDGRQMVKRGCARRDPRYDSHGCEDQLTGEGNFKVRLCLCGGDLCNGSGRGVRLEPFEMSNATPSEGLGEGTGLATLAVSACFLLSH